ncbi:hypothetical protein [Salinicoccus halitifaciens]|uniref:Cytochrome c oxidase subunit 2A n=1 Tax=Salinicoccus halitifaciens TaxID=1073415 RepID=A0ABV2ECK0_9STAP|nr:hypothetical protein [Salinicoccus halitifaciens]MCD2138694.1 hypothetical protein [Salinicoccus halitifaciens]
MKKRLREEEKPVERSTEEQLSLKGTLFSTIFFVGGSIVLWTGVLLVLFIMRF